MIGYPASTSAPAVFSYSILLFQKSKISLNNKISGFYSSRGLRLAWYNKDVSLVVDYKHTYLIECTNTVDKVVRVYICLLCSDEKKFVIYCTFSHTASASAPHQVPPANSNPASSFGCSSHWFKCSNRKRKLPVPVHTVPHKKPWLS